MTGQAGQDLIAACGQIVVINLPERADRRAEFEVQLNRIGLSFKDPSVRIFDAIRPTAREGFPSIGARGCFLSHLAVLRKALEDGAEKVLLCEDDLNFTQTFPSRARDLRAALDREDWDIFYGFTAGGLRGENLDAEGQLVALSGDHAFIGSNSSLVAPVEIGNGATVGAGSTITQNVAENSLAVERSKQFSKENYQRPQKIKK